MYLSATEVIKVTAMADYVRYAVYIAPEHGPLSGFAAAWLGWDPATGFSVAHPNVAGLTTPLAEITRSPRKYGFHGTIKPPFRLASGSTPERLMSDLADLTAELPPITLEGLELSRLGRFLALTVCGDQEPLANLASEVVRRLDHHRQPLTDEELTRRRSANLTPRQDELLQQWDYPYVMDQFKFHMTLTGRLPKAQIETTYEALQAKLAPLLPEPLHINDLCLFGEAQDGRFHLIHRYALSGQPN